MRRAIGDRMTKSVREQPQFSISRDVDMTLAGEKRKAAGASYTDTIVAAAAATLRDHPRLRARIEDGELVTSDAANIGLAIALDDGLIVAVLRDADRKSLRELAAERARLEEHARAGKLAEHELTGSVLTVSNLGTMGIDRFTAIVNPPEAAILAVGRVSDRVVAKDGVPAVRPMATLTLSVDHRVADGATAARYLSAVVERLERADL
jgi:pyruvate dehydrogenase E2 component (dihydrolipoamide acetyltransferase)